MVLPEFVKQNKVFLKGLFELIFLNNLDNRLIFAKFATFESNIASHFS